MKNTPKTTTQNLIATIDNADVPLLVSELSDKNRAFYNLAVIVYSGGTNYSPQTLQVLSNIIDYYGIENLRKKEVINTEGFISYYKIYTPIW